MCVKNDNIIVIIDQTKRQVKQAVTVLQQFWCLLVLIAVMTIRDDA